MKRDAKWRGAQSNLSQQRTGTPKEFFTYEGRKADLEKERNVTEITTV